MIWVKWKLIIYVINRFSGTIGPTIILASLFLKTNRIFRIFVSQFKRGSESTIPLGQVRSTLRYSYKARYHISIVFVHCRSTTPAQDTKWDFPQTSIHQNLVNEYFQIMFCLGLVSIQCIIVLLWITLDTPEVEDVYCEARHVRVCRSNALHMSLAEFYNVILGSIHY